MKASGCRAAALLGAIAISATGCGTTVAPRQEDSVARGRYLATVAACGDCHTPMAMGPGGPAPDMARMFSGHPEGLVMPDPPALPEGPWSWVASGTNTAFAGPWGGSYAPNLTPSEDTGIGAWTKEIFIRALRTGRHWGQGRPILPPMPWPAYSQMSEEDLGALYDYLRTVPPIENRAPDSQPAAPAG